MTLEEFTSQIEEILERHKSQRVEDFDYVPDVKTITSKNITLEDWNTIVTAIENVVTNNNTISETTIALFEIFKQYPEVIFTEFKEIVQDLVNKSDISTHISHLATKEELDNHIKNLSRLKENVSNKTTTLTSSSTHTQYPSAKVVYDRIQDVREVAEGKTKTFVLSYAFSIPTDIGLSVGNYYDADGNKINNSQDILNYLGSGWSLNDLVNSNFNSQENSIGLVSANSMGNFGFVCVEVGDKKIFAKVAENDKQFSFFKTGDIILVKETNVPDRWFTYNVAYKMETTKVDLSSVVHLDGQEDITGVKNFTNGIKIGNSPIIFSNNELQVVNDIVGNEGNNLGSQAKPFNKLYAKYFNDGSGTEAMLSDLTNGIIKEINIQNIHIWDLDTGIYKLTYSGTIHIYYAGSKNYTVDYSNQNSFLFVMSKPNYGQKMWQIFKDNNVLYGNTFSSGGEYYNGYPAINLKRVNGSSLLCDNGYLPTTAGTKGQVLISSGSGEPTWSSDIPTKTYVDNAIQTAIGNVLNGDF